MLLNEIALSGPSNLPPEFWAKVVNRLRDDLGQWDPQCKEDVENWAQFSLNTPGENLEQVFSQITTPLDHSTTSVFKN